MSTYPLTYQPKLTKTNRTFVNARPLPVLIEDIRMRIRRGDGLQERKDAIQAMVDIAKDRAGKMGG